MADPLNEPAIAGALAKLAALAPGFAGAVFSLAFVETLTRRGRFVAVLAGLLSSIFIAPAFCSIGDLFWPGDLPSSVTKAILFLTGLAAMGCLPKLLKWLEKLAGDPLSLLKVKVGPA